MKRVLVLLEQRANADLLAEHLGSHYEVIAGADDQPWPDSFDVGIVDGATLDRIEPLVKQRRAAELPVLLPFLLVTSRRDIGMATHHVWHSVDDLILTPIQKLELHARVEVLLRARELSLVNNRIISAAGEGILGLDAQGRITEANATAHLLLKFPEPELLGRSLWELLGTPPETEAGVLDEALLREALGSATPSRERNGWFQQRDGALIPVDYVMTPLEAGNPEAGAVLLFGDLSELQRLNDSLEQKVIARTAALVNANQELESFAYMVSHDLRAPLRTVNGFSHTLLEDYGELLDSDGQDCLRRIIAATTRMNGIIDGVLRLSRVSRSELARVRVSISDLARQAAEVIAARYPERTVAWRVADGLWADADPALVRTLLENLLDNAWKYTARCPAPAVEVGAMRGVEGQVFFVRDNGVGFDMRDEARLFKPFERLHDPAEYSGYGIGLAIANRVVTRHGGRIWARGEVGRGATFCFTLAPAADQIRLERGGGL